MLGTSTWTLPTKSATRRWYEYTDFANQERHEKRDQLINNTIRDTSTISQADRVAMVTYIIVVWYDQCDKKSK
jgi:hypothetical protein